MSKKGRQRRTPEHRLAAREARSTIGYILRIQREVEEEQREALAKELTEKK